MYSLNIALLMKMALDAPTISFAKFNVFVHNAEIMLGLNVVMVLLRKYNMDNTHGA